MSVRIRNGWIRTVGGRWSRLDEMSSLHVQGFLIGNRTLCAIVAEFSEHDYQPIGISEYFKDSGEAQDFLDRMMDEAT